MAMRVFLIGVLGAWLLPVSAFAQLLSDTPRCVTVKNATDIELIGHVETLLYTAPDGTMTQHDVNLGLKPGEEKPVCSTGPFFDGYRLRVVARTTVPQYSCLVETGKTVTISSTYDDEDQRVITMDCLREGARPPAP